MQGIIFAFLFAVIAETKIIGPVVISKTHDFEGIRADSGTDRFLFSTERYFRLEHLPTFLECFLDFQMMDDGCQHLGMGT